MRNVQKVLIGIFLSGVLLGGIGTGIVVQEFSSLGYGGRKLIGTEDLVTKEMDFALPMDGKAVILGYHGYMRDWEGSLVEDTSVPAGIVRYEITYNERLIEPHLTYVEYEEDEQSEEPEEMEHIELDRDEPDDGTGQGAEEILDSEEPLETAAEENQEGESGEERNQESQPREGQSHEEQNQPEQIREEQNQEGQPQEGEAARDSQKKEPVYGGELYLEARYKGNDFELFMENKDRILEELKQKKLSSYDIVYITQITIKVNHETKAYVKDLFFRY